MIALINPPWTFLPGSNYRPGSVPIHTLTAASAFIAEGFDVRVIDCTAGDPEPRKTDEEGVLEFGCTDEEIKEALIAIGKPELIGISCLWTVQFDNAVKCLQLAKEIYPDVPVAIGSHHATVRTAECLASGFDAVFVGELEGAAARFVKEATSRSSVICTNPEPVPNLDTFLFPAYQLIDMESYVKSSVRYHGSPIVGGVPIITSRGCPFACSFCTVHLSMGRKWRANSPEYVDSHLRLLKERYGVSHVYFEDDNLLMDRDRFVQIMRSLSKYEITWDTPNGVRLDHLDSNLLTQMKESGCKELRVSPESGSQKTLDSLIGKSLTLNKFAAVAERCLELALPLGAFWVIGIPGETIEDMKITLETARLASDNWKVTPRISIATPYPGTGLYKQCVEEGWLVRPLTPRSLAPATRFEGLIRTKEFGPEDIAKLLDGWSTWK